MTTGIDLFTRRRGVAEFDALLKRLPHLMRVHCKGAITNEFIEQELPRTHFVLLATRAALPARNPRAVHITRHAPCEGILIGYSRLEGGKRSAHVQLVCSRNHRGKELMVAAEKHAQHLGCASITLRAADAWLVGYYRQLGYERQADACRSPSRLDRRRLRALDSGAVTFRGPDQDTWWREHEGWWMSKCLACGDW